jgi:hypothetical protein
MSQDQKTQAASKAGEQGGKGSPWRNTSFLIGVLAFALVAMLAFMTVSASNTIDEVKTAEFNEGGFAVYLLSERGHRSFPQANDAGIAIYRQSEWNSGTTLKDSNLKGLEIYFESERNTIVVSPVTDTQAGLAIYHTSERELPVPAAKVSNEDGLAIYHESERNYSPARSVSDVGGGMAIYHDSEWGASAEPIRLYDGQPFNAYQRSEWLGEDR